MPDASCSRPPADTIRAGSDPCDPRVRGGPSGLATDRRRSLSGPYRIRHETLGNDGRQRSANSMPSRSATSRGWPSGRKRVVSAVIVFHAAAVLAAALAGSPSSPLERCGGGPVLGRIIRSIDQGYCVPLLRPRAGPDARSSRRRSGYADGRPERTVRLPERGVRPRLRYQRQLALANHLTARLRGGPAGDRRRPDAPVRAVVRPAPGAGVSRAAPRSRSTPSCT